jgi:Nif-specific regulatory protein
MGQKDTEMKIAERFEVIKSLGRGGWGEVYLVDDIQHKDQKPLALKLTHSDLSHSELHRLKQEFYLLTHLNHPNIMKVFDFGETAQKEYFITMEFIEGRKFSQYFAPRFSKGLGDGFFEAIIQLLSALHFIHKKGWVHSDLKPSNLLITLENQVKLLDFGFAKDFNGLSDFNLSDEKSEQDGLRGTVGYIAPEILKGERGDPRSDLYSMGIILYETLTQKLPFDGKTPLQTIRAQLEETPPLPHQVNPHIPKPLSEIVMKLLVKEPSNRYISTEEVLKDIAKLCKLENRDINFESAPSIEATTDHTKVFNPPLIAREDEIYKLKDLLQKTKGGTCNFVLLSGERGVGKSRLLQELKFQGQLDGFHVLMSHTSNTDRRPFQPVRQILRQIPVHGKLPFEPIASDLKLDFEKKDNGSAQDFKKWQIYDEVTNVFLNHSKHLLVLVDDFQLADKNTQELMAFMVRSLSQNRNTETQKSKNRKSGVLFVFAYESATESLPETFLEGTKRIRQNEINVSKLSENGTETLVSYLLEINRSKDTSQIKEATEWIYRQSGGFPLLIEETTKWLISEGILKIKKGKWTFQKSSLSKLSRKDIQNFTPSEIEDLIHHTLSRMDEESLKLLESASVIGDRFSSQALKSLVSLSEQELYPQLINLEGEHLIRREPEADDYYSFSHHWLRQYLYGRIPKDKRRESHQAILNIFEAMNLKENEIDLAYHALRGEEKEKSLRYGLRAGEFAEGSYNYNEALELYRGILPYVKEDDLKILVVEKIGDMYEKTGDYENSIELYNKALSYENNKDKHPRLHHKIGKVERKRSRYPEALESFEYGLSCVSEKNTSDTVNLLNGVGWIYREQGEYKKATETLLYAENLATETGDKEGLTLSLRNLATVNWSQSKFEDAIIFGEKALSIAKETQDDFQIAATSNNLGIFYWNTGKPDKARNLYSISQNIREKISDLQGLGSVYLNLGILEQDEGNWEKALQHYEKSLDVFEKLDDLVNLARLYNSFGYLFRAIGKWDEAYIHFTKSLDVVNDIENSLISTSVHMNLGRLFMYKGEFETAKDHLNIALSLSENYGDVEGMAVSLLYRAVLESESENWDEAGKYLKRAKNTFEGHGIKVELPLLFQTSSQYCLHNNEFEEALLLANKGLEEAIHQKNEEAIGYSHRNIGIILSKKEDDEKVIEQFLKARDIFKKTKNSYELAESLFAMAIFSLQRWQKTNHNDFFRSACDQLKQAESIFRNLRAQGKLEKIHSVNGQLVSQISEKPLPFGREDQLKTLYEVSQVINSILDLKTLLRRVMDLVINLLKAERGILLLKENGNLRVASGKNIDNSTIRDASELSKTILDQVTEEGISVISTDASLDPRFQEKQSVIFNNIRSLLCVPLMTQNKVIGTIYVDSRLTTHLFTEEDQAFLISLSNLIAVAIENAKFHDQLRKESNQLRKEVKDLYSDRNIIGNTIQIDELRNLIEHSASSDSTVLIQGETGTGKELVARAIHYQSQRSTQRFTPLVCGSVPESLLESELFGHKKGSFTGATSDAEGIFEAANGGTVFLDEIGDAPFSVQVKLLRVLEEGEIRRVGDTNPRKVDVRVICATNKNLVKEVEEGRFRQDLFFRINVILISIPPLRERKEDIPLLAHHFLTLNNEKSGKLISGISPETMDHLFKYSWPGNVRELENYIERAVVMAKADTISPKDIYPSLKIHQPQTSSLSQSRQETERRRIEESLTKSGGNITRAAMELGLHRQQLQRVMKRLSLTKEMFRK